MKNDKMANVVHGFKVFNPDWTCRNKQYTCPGKFEEEGELEVCCHGMHFCENPSDCFSYYDFDSNNKVAEVIAYGTVLKEGSKSCTDKIELVREIPWDEVLRIVNIGKNCTGFCNTGNKNTGDYNTGNKNTGDCNIGDNNTGDWNDGDCNTGHGNAGHWNAGDKNTGDLNTGDCNRGSWNTGDWNICDHSTGCFCTEEHPIMLFNKPSTWSYSDWIKSDAYYLLNIMQKNAVEWICSEHMTDEEKAEHPTHETTGGYLKALYASDCAQLWWDGLLDDEKEIIKSIPNFDAEIFFQCTGIRVDE